MDDTILSQYRPENYEKLSIDEKKNLIIQTIRTIQSQNDLDKTDIKFEPELGYCIFDHGSKGIVIDLEMDFTSYEMLCVLIHEVRHQWQFKQEGKLPQVAQGRDYILSPAEKDAYEYSITQMLTYSDFFNDDNFDLTMIDLIDEYVSRRNRSKLDYEICDYDVEEILPEILSYMELTSIYSLEELGKNPDIEELIPFYFKKISMPGLYNFNEKTNNLYFETDYGLKVSLINGKLYISSISDFELDNCSLDEVVEFISQGIECIKYFNEMGLNVEMPNIIHFPPAIVGPCGIKKKTYIDILNRLNCNKDKEVSLEDIRKFDKNYIIPHEIVDIDFGMDEYTTEQIEILDRAKKWNDDLEESINECEPSKKFTGFYAGFQYKKDYSPKKLELILEAQKQGLNTLFYDKLDEEQIKHLMELQLAGAKRSEWIDLIPDKKIQWLPESPSLRPKQLPYSDERIAEGIRSNNFEHELLSRDDNSQIKE